MSIEKKYKKLDDISHILQRSGMYVGSIKTHTDEKWIIDEDKLIHKSITYNPAFLKIFDEILINSVDESKREGSKLNTIKISINRETNKISIFDNGGIPVVKHKEHNEWIPEMIFSNLKAGSNFNDDEQRTTSGLNGVGSVLTNVFSKEFNISTCDGKNHFIQTFSNNMRDRTKPKVTKSTELMTELFEMFSQPGDTVIDPFLGSGTTLLVAQQMGRRCVGGEISPAYCTEIVARWEAMTQQKARRYSA
jgi:DNA topoisomerase-2